MELATVQENNVGGEQRRERELMLYDKFFIESSSNNIDRKPLNIKKDDRDESFRVDVKKNRTTVPSNKVYNTRSRAKTLEKSAMADKNYDYFDY